MRAPSFGPLALSVALTACGGSVAPMYAGVDAGLTAPALGGACTLLSLEQDASFGGFREGEVTVESASPECGGNVCLANHFRGRVGCPYGQDFTGAGPSGGPGCTVPGTGAMVAPQDPRTGAAVPAQCADRVARNAVYCSCRCANVDGRTDDGASYCSCPDGMTCTQLVSSIGQPGDTTSGAYCIKAGTEYVMSTACTQSCDPTANPC